MIKIIKRPYRMSDGSVSVDVLLRDVLDGRTIGTVELHAMSEEDADYLAETLRAAIVNYTVDDPATEELDLA
jgi:hypothetical protein